MKKYSFTIAMAMLAVSIFLYPTFSAGQTGTQVSYPDGYRLWTHIKSMVIEKGHPLYDSFGGIHHIYANKEAVHALNKGNHVLMVLSLFLSSLRQNAMTTILSMKNSKMFSDTAGWGFEAFKNDSKERLVKDQKNECFNCHEAQKKNDYIFSGYRK